MEQGNEAGTSLVPRLKSGALLGSRYRIEETAKTASSGEVWVGIDQQTELPIVAFEVAEASAKVMAPTLGVAHAHLARIYELVKTEAPSFIVIAEHVVGKSLADLLAEIGKKAAVDAVRSALRVADALSVLHAAGSAHGAVSDQTLIVFPNMHAAPMLTVAPRTPAPSPYRSPDTKPDDLPSEADDSWATAALLYHMLVGEPPPNSGFSAADQLIESGIDDATLREALAHGLASDSGLRSHDLRPLKRELARWFVDHAGEEVVPVPTHSSQPPPLPAGARSSQPPPSIVATSLGQVPGVTSSMATPVRKRSRRLSLLAGGGIVLGVVAAWGLSVVRNRPRVEYVEVDPKASAKATQAASASEKSIDLSEVPVTGETKAAMGDKMATCVAGYLPKNAFGKAPDLSAMCAEQDPREGADKLRSAIVAAAPVGAGPTDAMKIFSRLGWYDMAAFAVIRSGCCPDATPLTLPAPIKPCTGLDAPLRDLGKAVVNGQSYDEVLKAYSDGIVCEVKTGRSALFHKNGRPHPGEEAAFSEFVKAVQSP